MRAKIVHFSRYDFFFKEIDLSETQVFEKKVIPWGQRQWSQSVIANKTPGVDIHVYIMRMAQVNTVMKAEADAGAHALGAGGRMRLTLDRVLERLPVGLVPQCVTIPPNKAHRFEIPRCGWWRRKARVWIVTTPPTAPRETRIEAVFTLRCHTKLTVEMPVDGGCVRGRPAGDEDILAQLVLRTHAVNVSRTTTAGSTPAR